MVVGVGWCGSVGCGIVSIVRTSVRVHHSTVQFAASYNKLVDNVSLSLTSTSFYLTTLSNVFCACELVQCSGSVANCLTSICIEPSNFRSPADVHLSAVAASLSLSVDV